MDLERKYSFSEVGDILSAQKRYFAVLESCMDFLAGDKLPSETFMNRTYQFLKRLQKYRELFVQEEKTLSRSLALLETKLLSMK